MTRSVADHVPCAVRWTSRIAVAALLTAGVAGPRAIAAAPGAEPPEVMLYAAASLRDALETIAPACGKEAGARPLFNFGASSDLARQILAAGKADLFFSADESWMDKVTAAGLVDIASRHSLLSNRLVVVVPLHSPLTVSGAADLAGPAVKRLALADPDAVPAGKYARAWLETTQQWEAVRERVVPALDVRAALAAVETGAVDAGIVYRTDAAISKKVTVAYEVPEADGPRISYPLAALVDRPQQAAALRLEQCIAGDEAGRTFERFGFIVVRPAR